MAEGEIKSCLVMCSNLMVSLPDNGTVERGLQNLDPLVVIDFFMSETAARADVVLPGTVWCEDEGTTTNLEGRVVKSIKRPSRPARPGETGRSLTSSRREWGAGSFFRRRVHETSGTNGAKSAAEASLTITV
jgi:assimilatory nitrate reductase catalytic subunit